ncbi:unnamed protein product [Tuber melanosporum]|uniref:(Perigord truffle) hypothetical protein n=1 Tax=Tuber melanosporum (strain Mel28) TaxID=656061 RepID=D5G4U2_TUBMM|nr:uncharacterized protein GSTUM_00000200001 [Tuber melanosporum]CAZ79535.1 unnamed protein product [Tuber melanosporum]
MRWSASRSPSAAGVKFWYWIAGVILSTPPTKHRLLVAAPCHSPPFFPSFHLLGFCHKSEENFYIIRASPPPRGISHPPHSHRRIHCPSYTLLPIVVNFLTLPIPNPLLVDRSRESSLLFSRTNYAPIYTRDNHCRQRSSLSSMFFSAASAATPSNKSGDGDRADSEEETVVDDGEKNMLLSIISQLRPGADLSRITLPTFILEPKSMLERITNFMQHPETLLPMSEVEDPTERFISVVKFYLSGWHIKPAGVKKPLNPILGEYFTCYWDFNETSGTQAFYISEQTSHHPPKSSYFYMAPHHHIRIDGTLKPQSRFLGNSAASMMNSSVVVLRLLNRGAAYILTQPNMYVRGILFGKMKYELGDHSYVKCPELDLVADIEFKVKGFFTGAYNAIGGFIKRESTGEILYEITGSWNGEMFIKDALTGKRDLLFDATNASPTPPLVRPLSEQDGRESQKLWNPVTSALKKRDQDAATEEKFRVEDRQREEARLREADGVEWTPRFFRRVDPVRGEEEELDWVISTHIDGATPEEQIKQILTIAPILTGVRRNSKYDIPPHHSHHEKTLEETKGDSNLLDVSSHLQPASADTQVHRTPQPPPALEVDLIDFGSEANVKGDGLGPALVPTSKGIAAAGRFGSSGLDDMQELGGSLPETKTGSRREKLEPKPAGSSIVINDDGDSDRFEDAVEK